MSGRSIIIQGFIILTGLIFSIRLFSIQVLDDQYKLAAENNIVQEFIDYPYRGLIFDRDEQILVSNTPVYDLMVVPKEVEMEDSVELCHLLGITHEYFVDKIQKSRKYSSILASKFLEQIPNDEFAAIQDLLIQYKGFYPLARTVRDYPNASLSNALGYVGEISRTQLRRDTSRYYHSGDYIGITGIEKQYENYLRGRRGKRYNVVNVQGVVKGSWRDGEFDTVPVPGQSIRLTINSELQQYVEYIMRNKVGSAVAIDPNNGEILAIVSTPSYDPGLLSGRDLGKNFNEIQKDTLNPLFNRPLQATYPPGSMFKTIQALIALEEGRLQRGEKIFCEGNLIGDHAPPGLYDTKRAIAFSSNNFFYKVFRRIIQQNPDVNAYQDSRIGLEKWNRYIENFGLGRKLGIDLPNENRGYIPNVDYYDRMYGTNRWRFSNIYSLSIGQGELLVTPLQMANLGAILANKGFYYTPHIVNQIDGIPIENIERNDVGIAPTHFNEIIDGMEQVVTIGSGLRAFIPDIPVCGKTSTVENPHGADHSGFMGFAPKDNPKIAIAVYVENAGWGARAAASAAGLIIEKYLTGEINRPWIEEYLIRGDFSDPVRRVKKDTTQAIQEPVGSENL